MELVAKGAYDEYLTRNPVITFFKNKWQSHTNFVIHSDEVYFNGIFDWGQNVTCNIPKSGDLVTSIVLEITLPEINTMDPDVLFAWVDFIGNTLIESIEILCGEQKQDTRYGLFYTVWKDLTLTEDKKELYYKMIGQQTLITNVNENGKIKSYYNGLQTFKDHQPRTTLSIPLDFWFSDDFGSAIPLTSLQFTNINIKLQIKAFTDLYKSLGIVPFNNFNYPRLEGKLRVNYVLLNNNERKKLTQSPRNYLMTQVKRQVELVTSSEVKIRLNFTSNCKELIFCVQEDAVISTKNWPGTHNVKSLEFFRSPHYKKRVYKLFSMYIPVQLIEKILDYASKIKLTSIDNINNWNKFDTIDSSNKYPVEWADLILNGRSRFGKLSGTYLNTVIPYKHHTSFPKSKGIYILPFCLYPEDWKPSGTLDFAQIDNAELHIRFNNISSNNPGKVIIFALGYNEFRVCNGLGRLAHQR